MRLPALVLAVAFSSCSPAQAPDGGAAGGDSGGGSGGTGGGTVTGGGGGTGGTSGGTSTAGGSGFCVPGGWQTISLADAGISGSPLALTSFGDTLYVLAGSFMSFRFAQRSATGTWQQDRSSVPIPFNSTAIATVDTRGEAHALFDLSYLHRLPDAGWERTDVSSASINPVAPNTALALDRGDTPHIAFSTTDGLTASRGVYHFTRRADGGWSGSPVVLDWPYVPNEPAIAYHPHFGSMMICSNTQPGLDCRTPDASDGGWATRRLLSTQFLPSISVASDGTLHVVSSGGGGTLRYYQHPADGGPSIETSLAATPGSPAALLSKSARDPAGNTHVAYLDIASGGAQALRYVQVAPGGSVSSRATIACGSPMRPIERWDLTWTPLDGPVISYVTPDTGGTLAMP